MPAKKGYASGVERRGRLRPAIRRRVVSAALVATDVGLALFLWTAAYLLWNGGGISSGAASGQMIGASTVVTGVILWVTIRLVMGMYPGYGMDSVERLRRHTYSALVSVSIVSVLVIGFDASTYAPELMVLLGMLFLGPAFRKATTLSLRAVGVWGNPVIVLSYKDTGEEFIGMLRQEWGMGYIPVALFDYNLVPAGETFEKVPYEDTLLDAITFSAKLGVDTAIFATPYTRREQLANMVNLASKTFRYVLIVPNLAGVTNSAVIARDFNGTFAVEIKHTLLDPQARFLKRLLDILGSALGGLVISPALMLIGALIKLDSSGNVFYKHRRLGANDEHFDCLKFRTMRSDSDEVLQKYLEDPELRLEWERSHKLKNDPRVTRVGRILRKTSLDELPQLWNVLTGEMSLIGPRPIVDDEVIRYEDGYDLYKRIRPGMSGFWQVSGRSDTDYAERVDMDSYYVRNWSVWLDVVILVRTVSIVLKGRGAY